MKLALSLLVLNLLAFGCECCYFKYPFGHSNCTFEVAYNDFSCTDFTFTKCTYTQCSNGQSGCAQTSSYFSTGNSTNWAFCTKSCCDPAVTYSQNAGAIQQCQAYLDWQIHLPVIIAFSCIIAVAIIIVIICCICCICHCPESCQGGRNCCWDCIGAIGRWIAYAICCTFLRPVSLQAQPRRGYILSEPSLVFQPPEPQEPEQIKRQTVKRQTQGTWKKERGGNIKNEDVCGICHFDRPLVRLRCQHVFHLKCVVGSVRKRQGCSVCGSNFETIRVYCEQCSFFFFETRLMENLDSLSDFQHVCPSCVGEEVARELLE